jgi:hypothetical protein
VGCGQHVIHGRSSMVGPRGVGGAGSQPVVAHVVGPWWHVQLAGGGAGRRPTAARVGKVDDWL